MKMRPVNMYEQQMFGGSGSGTIDLSQPDLSSSLPPSMQGNQKYPSPQAVVDEILQQPAPSQQQQQQRKPHTFNRRRTRTPTKQGGGMIQPSGSFDVVDFGHNAFAATSGNINSRSPLKRGSSHRRSQSSSMSWVSGGSSGSGNSSNVPRRHVGRSNSNHSLGGGSRHRRSQSTQSSSHHRRSSSSAAEDVFLHGVVAQTRFV